jgi:vacuolar-type H+-ATPase subunit I/STV1
MTGSRSLGLIEAAFILALAGLAIGDGLRIVEQETATIGAQEAGGWLLLVASLLVVAVLVYAGQQWNASAREEPATGNESVAPVATASGLLVAYLICLPFLGYMAATFLFVMSYVLWFGRYRTIYVVAGALAAAVLSSWLWEGIDLNLPKGLLPWW